MTVKSRLLEILEKEKGETLSGEKLAEELHCTRAAIWKAVKSLREEGYMIEAGPKKAVYIQPAIIRNCTRCQTVSTGTSHTYRHDTSTNMFAIDTKMCRLFIVRS